MFTKVAPRSISDEIVDQVISAIFSGKLPAGSKLPAERALSQAFGVGRQALREAIQKLQGMGLLNDAALREVLKHIRAGQTEIAVACEAEYIARQMGADFGSAKVIMSDPNTEYPAWRPSLRVLQPGDFVLADFNPCYEHSCNDGGITVLLPGGRPE